MSRSRVLLPALLWLLTVSAVIELLVLRTATRTLIHIPGTERFETPIRLLAETGRLAYYLAAVSLTVALTTLALVGLRSRSSRRVASGAAVVVFIAVAVAGRVEILPWRVAGWATLAILVLVGLMGWRGLPSLPVGLFVAAFVAAGSSVVAQVAGTGLTGGQVDALVWASEFSLVAAGLATPLLLKRAPGKSSWVIGAITATLAVGAFISGASTITILVLWNVGVPGWLPGVAYALAFGCLSATLWSAVVRGERSVAIGVVLLTAGGVGLMSTYQSGLVLAGVLLLGEFGDLLSQPAMRRMDDADVFSPTSIAHETSVSVRVPEVSLAEGVGRITRDRGQISTIPAV
jgi:hypothetical protein